MPHEATTPTAAASAAAAQKGKERKGKRSDGTRKRAEIDRAQTRIEEPPQKLAQSTATTNAMEAPAAAASYAAAAEAAEDVAMRDVDGGGLEQDRLQEADASDLEVPDGDDSHDSHAADGEASSASSAGEWFLPLPDPISFSGVGANCWHRGVAPLFALHQ